MFVVIFIFLKLYTTAEKMMSNIKTLVEDNQIFTFRLREQRMITAFALNSNMRFQNVLLSLLVFSYSFKYITSNQIKQRLFIY